MSKANPFEPVGHETIADAVVNQIETMIVDGVLKEGHQLPSERDLALMMQVSRPKIREALQLLEERGLVTVRHGEGAFIASLTGSAMSPALLELYARHGETFYDYLEYRREQEAFAARLAAFRATPADKQRIADIMEALQHSWEANDQDASLQADFNFHTAITDASQNSTLIHMMASIYDLTKSRIFYNRTFLLSIDGSGKRLLEQHLEIGNAVLAGDAERADHAARSHLDFVERSFREGQQQSLREIKALKRQQLSR
ncbi:FadR/GntR family transcriptional regulator [Cohaesibacter celericrescens]|uniref:Pyruvate dehydrogenase complex repressor n=1 Tax=Cohaesibacter celericrescens TaxID=2067669 RepID=A0A2N5XP85_9HYPH|nr:FadR/GntR family transcriptional regulator [Cohaesibacter celericrescens]PLW76295.1 GntR family transcriptional regulator [Cohaesibacter celericrescens]